MVAIRQKGIRPLHVVSLKMLKNSLSYARIDGDSLLIGSMTTISDLSEFLRGAKEYEVLFEGIHSIGSYQIRNIATIGGNLCNASPAADSAPPLMVLGASLKVRGAQEERIIPIKEFFLGPGKTALNRGDVLEEIKVTLPPPHSGGAFVKLGRREGEDIAVASVAAYVELDGTRIKNARVALGSVAPFPMRAIKTESLLRGELSDSLLEKVAMTSSKECQPIDDTRATASYRRRAIGALARLAITKAVQRAGGPSHS